MQMGQQQNIDSRTLDYICWDREYFDQFFYQVFDIDQVIQGAGRTLTIINVGNVHLTV